MSRSGLALALLAFAAIAPVARAQAPADSTVEGYVRSMADSTDAWFGLSARPADTTGIDSARTYRLAHPGAAGGRRGLGLSLAPLLTFNRTLGPAWGGEASIRLPAGTGRLGASAQRAVAAKLWLGGGELAKRWQSDSNEDFWRASASAGRRCESMDRDRFDPFFSALGAFVGGSDRTHYLRRDGARALVERGTTRAWGRLQVRDELESPLATTATWNLSQAVPAVVRNDSAATGRVREVYAHGGLRLPHSSFRLDAQAWSAGGALGGGLAYTRTDVAIGGPIALGRHLVLAPQAEYGRLTGAAPPQDVFYLGGGTLRTVDEHGLQGTGRAIARADLLVMDAVQTLLGLERAPTFPIQLGAFVGTGARWGYDPASGRAALTRLDWPRRREWLSEAGVSVMYRPGLPHPDSFVRLDYAVPLGAGARAAKYYFSYATALNFLRRL
jgi:hypothetical protein